MRKLELINMSKLLLTIAALLPILCGADHGWYPVYHVAPPQGWMNDPNGLSYFDGYYHAFYQHYPYAPEWGLMHWGHARSKNMLNWEHLPIALTPSLPEDIDGIFSGSGVVNEGNLTLMYTGVSGNSTHQEQCLAYSSDGVNFTKEGVVLKKGGNDENFRDPKLWWQDDSWFVVIGSKTDDNRGEVLLYRSPDLKDWSYEGVLASADDKLGYMWECPDFFTLNNKQILLINPQGVEQDGYDYQNLYQTGYFVGSWAPGGNYTVEEGFKEIDHGHDFYASQTFFAPDGRRILIGWLAMWESEFPERADGWAAMLTLPRELTLSESNVIEVRPIREVQEYREEISSNSEPITISGGAPYGLLADAKANEVTVRFDTASTTAKTYGLFFGNEAGSLNISVNVDLGRLFVTRYYPNYNITESERSVAVDLSGPLNLDVFLDSSSIEIFVNDGAGVLSSRIYPVDGQRDLVAYQTDGVAVLSQYSVWNLNV
ncbi:sucrose-6-phosphate hydrolase-like isoform X1 [Rhynchophorus ferrugineus]|uniref:sucrose-6-phosphate hydrolase-like isoform X1 n=2 Tax=Rhynchophorus ferrugineus TaxID=354439 RepID=UPI003FCC5888